MSRLSNLCWSTIDLNVLRSLPRVELPQSMHLQSDCGGGCAGDPPGFPTYFTRDVYSATGNSPRRNWKGHCKVISFGGVLHGVEPNIWSEKDTWDSRRETQHKLFMRLWNKLPLDHPRTVAWIQSTYIHHRHCYQSSSKTGSWSDKMIIYPVPSYKLRHFHDDSRFNDDWRAKEKASIEAYNANIMEMATREATWDNHDATILIRRFYPEWDVPEHNRDLYLEPEWDHPGNWWETLESRPTPETCPGQYSMKHPCNITWCQMCGYKTEEALV
jgi:hypothetical protein